jgi:hypothetical protein
VRAFIPQLLVPCVERNANFASVPLVSAVASEPAPEEGARVALEARRSGADALVDSAIAAIANPSAQASTAIRRARRDIY